MCTQGLRRFDIQMGFESVLRSTVDKKGRSLVIGARMTKTTELYMIYNFIVKHFNTFFGVLYINI